METLVTFSIKFDKGDNFLMSKPRFSVKNIKLSANVSFCYMFSDALYPEGTTLKKSTDLLRTFRCKV